MKKLILFLSFFLAFGTFASAQSLSLYYDGVELADGDNVYIHGELTDNEFEEYLAVLLVKNNSDRDLPVKARRDDVDIVEGSKNYLCWESCFPDFVVESPDPYTIPAGEMTSEEIFAGHYLPQGNAGTTIVKYTFFNANEPDDKVTFNAHYVISPTSVDDILAKSAISEAYPNPASKFVAFDYELPVEVKSAEVKFFNLLGQEVLTETIADLIGKVQINVMDLPEGVYFYSLALNQKVAMTKKLIIRR